MSRRRFFEWYRSTVVIGLTVVAVLAVGSTVWGQAPNCCQYPCQFPPAGQVRFPVMGHTEAQIGVPPSPVVFDVLGPAMVMLADPRPDPAGDIIQTEMLALELTGMSSMGQPVRMHLTPGTRSMGQITGQPSPSSCDLPAVQSFFDVFVEIAVDISPSQTDDMYVGLPDNQYRSVQVNSFNLQCIPPQPGAVWTTPQGVQYPLTSRSTNQQVGVLTFATGTVLEPNHYKTWRIDDFSPLQIRTIVAKDQFGVSNLVLDSAVYLSNPVQKCIAGTCFNVADTTDHFTWYRANGPPVALQVDYQNQFGSGTIGIDSVKYFLTPTHKFPHNPPKLLDHYKAYRIRNPQPITTQVQLTDQFDLADPRGPEQITTLVPRYFLTPAQKSFQGVTYPVYDTLTHFVAYEIFPKRPIMMNRDIEDQFGIHPIRVDSSVFLLVPTCKLRAQPPPTGCCLPTGQCVLAPDSATCIAQGGTPVTACLGDANGNGIDDACEQPHPTGPNHFKTWRVLQQDPVTFRSVYVRDQFLKFMKDSTVRFDSINYLSNPTRKIVINAAGLPDTFNVVDTTDHLSWYRAFGNNLLKGLQVGFQNQFQTDTIRIDLLRYFLLPTRKFPHNPPDSLDHYKAYRIRGAKKIRRPIELQDQFDLQSPVPVERIDSLVERYFLAPARKQIPGQQPEPVYDTVTHYVAYQIYPARHLPQVRDLEDQFGVHIVQVDSSELLLVPTKKLFVAPKLKGDLNGSLDLTPTDVVLMLNCVYLQSGDCDLSYGDVDCSGALSPADVVRELNAVYLLADFPC